MIVPQIVRDRQRSVPSAGATLHHSQIRRAAIDRRTVARPADLRRPNRTYAAQHVGATVSKPFLNDTEWLRVAVDNQKLLRQQQIRFPETQGHRRPMDAISSDKRSESMHGVVVERCALDGTRGRVSNDRASPVSTGNFSPRRASAATTVTAKVRRRPVCGLPTETSPRARCRDDARHSHPHCPIQAR